MTEIKKAANPMRQIRIEKVTLNVGAGKNQDLLSKGMKLLEKLAGRPPVKTITQKRIAGWGLRPGLPIGCKVTIRGAGAIELFKKMLGAKDNILEDSKFDNKGNLSFGIPEYIDIPGAEYDPEIGIIGLQVSVTLERPGFRIKKRRLKNKKISASHEINKDDAIEFMKKEFKVILAEED